VGHVEFIGSDGIICRSGDFGSRRYGNDHCYEWLGQHDCDSDGESGRFERNTVTYEPVVRVGRGNGNAHTDGEGCSWDHDLGCHGDVGHVEFIGSDGIICRSGDFGSRRYGNDHRYEWLGQYDCNYDGESGRCSRRAVTDEPVACVGRGNGNTHTDGDGCRWGCDLGCHGDVGYVEFIGSDGIVCGAGDFGSRRYGNDHGHIGFGEQDRDSYGESGRVGRRARTDEPVVRIGR
jgi:hypothetical protein